MSDEILTSLDDAGIFTITLNRPKALNALNHVVLRRLTEITRRAAIDLDVRVVVLTGTGRAFSAGGDIHSFGTSDPEDALALKHAQNPLWNSQEARAERLNLAADASKLLHTMGKPTIASLRGPVAGAAMSLALACDFRIASDTMFMTSAFAKIGASGDYGGSYFLTKLVGPSKAREIYFFSERIEAQECLRIGTVNKLVADDALEAETMVFANRLAKGPPLAYRAIKENINAAEWQGMHETIAIESRNMARTNLSQDAVEARKAFFEKREAQFKGV